MTKLPDVGRFVQFGPAATRADELDKGTTLNDLKMQSLVLLHPLLDPESGRLREIIHSDNPDIATEYEIIELLAVIRDDIGAHPDHINSVIEYLILAAEQRQ